MKTIKSSWKCPKNKKRKTKSILDTTKMNRSIDY